ncbi:MAG: hypothetical protein CL825_00615 [Crocinitomicaceae bacterium]|nr:hypothetical protein [Crocinitomicaceae bacterium]
MQKFILKVAFLSALFLAAGYIIPAFKPVGVSLVWVLVVLLYSALTIVLRAWINRVKNASPIKFTTAVSGTTAVKMFSTLAIITIYMASKQPNTLHFAFGVFALFLGNTALFVADAQRLVRKR